MTIITKEQRVQKYQKYYSENRLWNKVKSVAKKAGIKVVYTALVLYYAIDSMPIEKKAVVIGALGYFILPTDLIPDFIAIFGFSDDASVLYMVYNACSDAIDEKVKNQATSKLSEWFGDIDESKLQ